MDIYSLPMHENIYILENICHIRHSLIFIIFYDFPCICLIIRAFDNKIASFSTFHLLWQIIVAVKHPPQYAERHRFFDIALIGQFGTYLGGGAKYGIGRA